MPSVELLGQTNSHEADKQKFCGSFLEALVTPVKTITMGNRTNEETPAKGTTPQSDGPPDAGSPDYIAESPPKRSLL